MKSPTPPKTKIPGRAKKDQFKDSQMPGAPKIPPMPKKGNPFAAKGNPFAKKGKA